MFVDAHFHLGYSPSYHYIDTSVSRYVQYMKRMNISYCMNIHSLGLITDELEQGMEEDLKAYELSNGSILSYYVFDPNRSEESLKVMERYGNRSIFKAIKLHPSFHGVFADDARYEAAWEYATANRLPIMSHTWAISSHNAAQKYAYPPLFERYVSRYPQVDLIFGHSGGRYDGIKQTVRLAQNYPNVYMDTAGDVYNNRLIEYLTREAGADKILFGSDGFWMDARTQLGMIMGADIPLAEKQKILFENARRLFKISG